MSIRNASGFGRTFAKASALKVKAAVPLPALVLEGKQKGRLLYTGMPAGYEFGVLIEALLDLARGATKLSPFTRTQLAKLPGPVHIKVFVTPT